MDKKGIIQDLRKRKILHRPLHTSHPSFTNWAQSFCRNTKLSERLKWHDYFLLGLRFFFPSWKKHKGVSSVPPAVTDKRKLEVNPLEMARYLRDVLQFTSSAALAMVQRETYSFFTPVVEQSHIVPPCWRTLFTKPRQHNGPSQKGALEHIDSYICCSHRTVGWHSLFRFACGTSEILEKLDLSYSQTRALRTMSASLSLQKRLKPAHSKKSKKAGKWKIICPRRKYIYCTVNSYHASYFTENKTRKEITAHGKIWSAAV